MSDDYKTLKEDLQHQLTFEHIDWEYFIETVKRTQAVDPSEEMYQKDKITPPKEAIIHCPDCDQNMKFRPWGRWGNPSFECLTENCSGYVTANNGGEPVAIPANQETRAYRYIVMQIKKWGVTLTKPVGQMSLEECQAVLEPFDVEVTYIPQPKLRKGYVLQLTYDQKGSGISVPPEKRVMETPR